MKAPQIKDKQARQNFQKQEEKQRTLKTLKSNSIGQANWWARHKLSSFSNQQFNNRCILTSRSGSTNRSYKLSRLEFRRWAYASKLPGLGKGSW